MNTDTTHTGRTLSKETIVGWIVIIAIVLFIIGMATGSLHHTGNRLSNERVGLSPPACINQQPTRCEAEEAEAKTEAHGAAVAEHDNEEAARTSE